MTITAVFAVMFLSFHHLSYASVVKHAPAAIAVMQADQHTHGQTGPTSGLEEHSHPQGVVPAGTAEIRVSEKEAWLTVTDTMARIASGTLERPPRASAP